MRQLGRRNQAVQADVYSAEGFSDAKLFSKRFRASGEIVLIQPTLRSTLPLCADCTREAVESEPRETQTAISKVSLDGLGNEHPHTIAPHGQDVPTFKIPSGNRTLCHVSPGAAFGGGVVVCLCLLYLLACGEDMPDFYRLSDGFV